MKARYATIRISEQLLKRALHMPESCSIIAGAVENKCVWPELVLIVESPDLPLVEIDKVESAPGVSPTVTLVPETWEWDWKTDGTSAAGDLLTGVVGE